MSRGQWGSRSVVALATSAILLMTGLTGVTSADPLDPIIAIDLNIQSGEPQPPSINQPVWNSTYDWMNGHGYNTWTAAKQTSLPEGYEMRHGYENRPGLWVWPKGSYSLGGLFPKLYPPGHAEFAFTAPGTTRIARAKFDTEYRSSLYLSHCTEFGLRTGTTSRAKNRNCAAPLPDRIEVGTSGEKSFRKVSLFDPAADPTSKDLYARIEIPKCTPLPDLACSKLIASLNPLTAGAYLRLGKVELTLVDDDLPVVTPSGPFFDLRNKYIDGKSSYPLVIADTDAGAGIELTRFDHAAPDAEVSALGSKTANCDLTHNTAQLGSRICPPTDSLNLTVDTTSYPEGTHAFRAWAADPANNVGENRWSVIVDRTAPAAPSNVYFITPAKGSAQVYWDESTDPVLSDGTRSSGTTHYRFRSQINGGGWSNWSEVSRSRQLSNEIVDQPAGTVVTFEVVAVDAVGNVSVPSTMTGVVHDPDEDTLPGGSGTPDDPAPGASAPTNDEGAEAESGSPSNIPTGAVPISLNVTNGNSPPAIGMPIWNSSYPWQQSSGYNEWTPNVQSDLSNGYELKRGHEGRPGLWIWPVGSHAAGNSLYPPGYAEFAFTAPGTTRIARASVDLAYRNALYASHCTEIGLRSAAGPRDRDTDCLAPIPDRIVINGDGETSYRNVPLFDPDANPTAKEAYARMFIPSCTLLSIELCSQLIPTQDPLHFGPYLQVQRVDMTLIDDDRPFTQVSGSLADLNGKYIRGSATYQLGTTSSDAGAGVASMQIEHTSPAPASQKQTLDAKPATCDPSHGTPGLGARICTVEDSLAIPVDTTTFPEGRNRVRVWATDPAGNVGERRLSVIVDRTAPDSPRVKPLKPDEGSAQTYWDEAFDPALPDGTKGSGLDHYEYRSKIDTGDWTDWKSVPRSQQISDEVFDKPIGTVVSFAVVAVDKMGNRSIESVNNVQVRGKTPKIAIEGELGLLDEKYTRGLSPVDAHLVSSDDEAGVNDVTLADRGGVFSETVVAPCVSAGHRFAESKRECPKSFLRTVSVPLPAFPEGAHPFDATARDRVSNPSISTVTPYIDRTAPAPPSSVSADFQYDPDAGLPNPATLIWQLSVDPPLPDGTPGSGWLRDEVRWSLDGSAYNEWRVNATGSVLVDDDAYPDEQISLQIRSIDAVGNVSDISTIAVRLTAPTNSDTIALSERVENARQFRDDFGFAQPSQAALEAMESNPAYDESQADYGVALTPDEFVEMNSRVEREPEIAAIQDVAGSMYPDTYAGTSIDHENGGKLRLMFTSGATSKTAQVTANFSRPDLVVPVDADYSGQLLFNTYATVSDSTDDIDSNYGTDVTSVGVNVDDNRVDVGILPFSASVAAGIRAEFGNQVRVIEGEPLIDDKSRTDLFTRQQAGLLISNGGTCTSAFSAVDVSVSPKKYFVLTAGHCGTGTWTKGFTGAVLGDVTRRSFADGKTAEAEAISVSHGQTSNGLFVPRYTRRVYRVETISNDEVKGQVVCQSGSTSGVRCGKLLERNYSAPSKVGGDKIWFYNLRRATYKAAGGDSGGPIYRKVSRKRAVAVGIHKGRFGIRSRAVYSHVQRVENELNLLICLPGRELCGK